MYLLRWTIAHLLEVDRPSLCEKSMRESDLPS